jgi:predicted N-acetyltransferase YhbS
MSSELASAPRWSARGSNARVRTRGEIFILGSPAYYGRFGFDAAAAAGYTAPYWGWPFMALILDDAVPRTGNIGFPDAFADDIKQYPALLNSLKAP